MSARALLSSFKHNLISLAYIKQRDLRTSILKHIYLLNFPIKIYLPKAHLSHRINQIAFKILFMGGKHLLASYVKLLKCTFSSSSLLYFHTLLLSRGKTN